MLEGEETETWLEEEEEEVAIRMEREEESATRLEGEDESAARLVGGQESANKLDDQEEPPLCHKTSMLHKKSFVGDLTLLEKISLKDLQKRRE